MGKSRRGSKEITRERRLIEENRELKRENGRLKKQLARFDLDKILEENQEDEPFQPILIPVEKEYPCHRPGCLGFLEIVKYPKLGNIWYYRACNSCSNRTTGKRYDASTVQGKIKK